MSIVVLGREGQLLPDKRGCCHCRQRWRLAKAIAVGLFFLAMVAKKTVNLLRIKRVYNDYTKDRDGRVNSQAR